VPEQKPPPFDEAAARAEIERLQDALQAARKARNEKSEEFDRFIRSFQNPGSSRTTAENVPRRSAGVVSDDGASTPVSAPAADVPVRALPSAVRRPRRVGILAAGAAAVVVVVIALALPRNRTPQPSPVPPAAVTVPSKDAVKVEAPPSPPQPAPAPAARAGVQLELRTLAPVWIRVVVDGEKKIEDVIPAAQRLSFNAAQSIVVRAGNGGDVLVTIDNHEDRFGAADHPLTRTFVPPEQKSPQD